MKTKGIWIIGCAGIGLAVAGLTGCSGTTTPETTASTGPTPTASALSDGGCAVADASGQTKNTDMQAAATQVYEALDCGATEPLPDQLKAAAKSAPVVASVKQAGATAEVDSAAGGTVFKVVAGTSACQVTVLDATDAKMLVCADM